MYSNLRKQCRDNYDCAAMVDAGNDLIACRQERAHACIQGRAHSVHTWHARIQVVSNNDALELVVRD